MSSPPIKYKYEKKDVQKNEKKELSISYKLYSKFFKPEFNMESIKIGDKIECPFNNCNDSSSSLAKLVTHINTNHQDKLTVISDYYCSVCGRKLTDIVSQIIHNIEHQYKKRRKIFSRDCSTTSTTASSLLNPLSSISNSFIPINTSLSLPHSNIKNKSLNSKSSKLKRKYPYDNSSNVISNDASINNLTKNIDKRKENNNYPLTPSPTSSLSQNLHTSPSKINNMIINEDQSKENNVSLNVNSNIKDIEKIKKLKVHSNEFSKENNLSLNIENSLKKNVTGKVQLQLGQTSDNILQLKTSQTKTISNNKNVNENKLLINNMPSPGLSPVTNKINNQQYKGNK